MLNQSKIINFKSQIIFLIIYFCIRVFSFYFSPGLLFNSAISTIILAITAYLIFKKNIYGWIVVAGEIILGGAGGFLSIGPIALRTCLLLISLTAYGLQNLSKIRLIFKNPLIYIAIYRNIFTIILLFIVIFSSIKGLLGNHDLNAVFSDAIPYFFFFYYFPLRDLWPSEKFKQIAIAMLYSAIIGNAIFILSIFTAYSSGILALQDSYYHWFRDIVGGKITDLNNNFYRIVVNEHLLLIPVLLLFLNKLINKDKRDGQKIQLFYYYIISLLIIAILSINLSRIYILAYFIGLFFLFNSKYWKRWLAYSFGTISIFIFIFSAIHFTSSGWKSFGLNLLGLRIGSISSPSIEASSLSRMMLLPKILDKIKQRPIFGYGLGDTIMVYSPVIKKEITTAQFDWGYLEIWDEMGIVGLFAWLGLLFSIYRLLIKQKINKIITNNKLGLLSALVGLSIINLTSPALFHVLGIILLVFLINAIISPQCIYEKN